MARSPAKRESRPYQDAFVKIGPQTLCSDKTRVYVTAMNRRQAQARRSRGALLLMVLAFLSVLAPVLADTYLCPMAKAAQVARVAAQEHKSSCCAKAEMAPPAAPGTVQWQTACDCPELSWDAAPAEITRESLAGSQPVAVLASFLPRLIEQTATPRFILPMPLRVVAPSGPPLWVRNQAILC